MPSVRSQAKMKHPQLQAKADWNTSAASMLNKYWQMIVRMHLAGHDG